MKKFQQILNHPNNPSSQLKQSTLMILKMKLRKRNLLTYLLHHLDLTTQRVPQVTILKNQIQWCPSQYLLSSHKIKVKLHLLHLHPLALLKRINITRNRNKMEKTKIRLHAINLSILLSIKKVMCLLHLHLLPQKHY